VAPAPFPNANTICKMQRIALGAIFFKKKDVSGTCVFVQGVSLTGVFAQSPVDRRIVIKFFD
jgi:hypothetical protein